VSVGYQSFRDEEADELAADRSLPKRTLALSGGPESTSNVTALLIKTGVGVLQSEN
jgi:hypothetical protein